MRNLAGGTMFLGTTALLAGFLFYFQPTVEAVTLASISQKDLLQFNQDNTNQNNIQNQQVSQQDIKQNQPDQQTQTLQPQASESPADPESINKLVLEANAFRATAYCLKGRTAMGGGVRRRQCRSARFAARFANPD